MSQTTKGIRDPPRQSPLTPLIGDASIISHSITPSARLQGPQGPDLRLPNIGEVQSRSISQSPVGHDSNQAPPVEDSTATSSQSGCSTTNSATRKADNTHTLDPFQPHSVLLQSKSKQFRIAWCMAWSTIILSGFSTWYVWVVFISDNPVPRTLALSPGRTLLVIQIITHVIAFMVWQIIESALELLRWTLATGATGLSIPTFFAMSRATSLLGVASLCLMGGSHRFWCVSRLLLAALATLVGIILTTNVEYKYVYTSDYSSQVDVVAGLVPLDYAIETYLHSAGRDNNIPSSVVNVYFMAFTYGFLSDSRFVTSIPAISCDPSANCTSIFLPGGINLIRRLGPDGGPNSTLFDNTSHYDGNTYANAPALITQNAPGFQIEFSSIKNYAFDKASNCAQYGNSTGEGLYLCLASNDSDIVAGWSVCPSKIYNASLCKEDTSWTKTLDQITTMSLYKCYATVAYDPRNLSILSVISVTDPTPIDSDAAFSMARNLSEIYALGLELFPLPPLFNSSSQDFSDAATIFSSQFDIGWALRLYQDDYPNYVAGPITVLQNFLAVPIQFATTALQWADFSSLPPDLQTTVTTAQVAYRAFSQPWKFYVFVALTFSLPIYAMVILAYSHNSSHPIPDSSLYPEFDILAKEPLFHNNNQANRDLPTDVKGLGYTIHEEFAGNATSSRAKKVIKGKYICVRHLQRTEDAQIVVIVLDKEQAASFNSRSTARAKRVKSLRKTLLSRRKRHAGEGADGTEVMMSTEGEARTEGMLRPDEVMGPLSTLREGQRYI